jgi:hypothetical protein
VQLMLKIGSYSSFPAAYRMWRSRPCLPLLGILALFRLLPQLPSPSRRVSAFVAAGAATRVPWPVPASRLAQCSPRFCLPHLCFRNACRRRHQIRAFQGQLDEAGKLWARKGDRVSDTNIPHSLVLCLRCFLPSLATLPVLLRPSGPLLCCSGGLVSLCFQ